MKYLACLIFLLISGAADAAYYCGTNDIHFESLTACNVNCEDTCTELTYSAGANACPSGYSSFIYDRQSGTTYGVSLNQQTWNANQQFIAGSEHKAEIVSILANLSGRSLWLGLYDTAMSTAYGTVNKSNYAWTDGLAVTYDNFAAGQPDNKIDGADIGTVTIYGEHWVYADTDGKWYDDGQHASYGGDYLPRHYGIGAFSGMLDCVAGLPQNTISDTNDIENTFCSDPSQECTLCVHDDMAEQCINGTTSGGLYAGLCPQDIVDCDSDLQIPLCPSGSIYSPSRNECVKDATPICPTGYTYVDGKCLKIPSCPVGYTYSSSLNKCYVTTTTYNCSFGGSYSSLTTCQANCTASGNPSSCLRWDGSYCVVADIPADTCNEDSWPYWYDGDTALKDCQNVSIVPYAVPAYVSWLSQGAWEQVEINIPNVSGTIYLEYAVRDDMVVNVHRDGVLIYSHGNGSSAGSGSYTAVFSGQNLHISVWGDDGDGIPRVYLKIRKTDITGTCSTSNSTSYSSAICTYDGTLNTSSDKCETIPNYSCPIDMLLAGEECAADFTCPSGYVFNPYLNKCEKATCTLNPNGCVNIAPPGTAPDYKCSPHQCLDPNDPSYLDISEDTQEGANDKLNDGNKDDSGQCLDQIYIFNGGDRRCRPPGTQTGFSDCCKKDETWFGLGKCSSGEQALSALRDWGELDGQCHYVGEYCAAKWGICPACVCVQKKKTYCCFGSPLGRIIAEQGRDQLSFNFGTAKSPNCRGFTPDEFQKLDFSKINFSEWLDTFVNPEMMPNVEGTIINTFENIQLPEAVQ
jgi:hypothetical protein